MSVDMKDYLAYQEGYEAGKRDAASPWHRVEDGHPEGMRRCVIFDGYTMTTAYWIGGFRNEKRYWRKVDIGGKSRGMFPDSKVKMWMYVPEPPKEDA